MGEMEGITEHMRTILIDWLIDVTEHYNHSTETLHLAISYLDRIMPALNVTKDNLQLIGITCMKIADVYNENSKEYYKLENSIEYSHITSNEYTPEKIIETEKDILKLLGFKLGIPSSINFLNIFIQMLDLP